MISTKYPEDFEEFWQIFDLVVDGGLGQKGNKKRAYQRFKEKKIEPSDFDFIREAVERQVLAKQFIRSMGKFDPDFMHVEGWINNERWDDEISKPTNQLAKSDERKSAAILRFRARVGRDME